MNNLLREQMDKFVPEINRYLSSLELVDSELSGLAPGLPEMLDYCLHAGGKQ